MKNGSAVAKVVVYFFLITCLSLLTLLFTTDLNSFLLSRFSYNCKIPFAYYIPHEIVTNKHIKDIDMLIVGGSSTREVFSLLSPSKKLSKLCNNEVNAFNAATSSQSLADSMAIIDGIIAKGAKLNTIVVGMTNNRLSREWRTWSDVINGRKLALPVSTTLIDKLNPIKKIEWLFEDKVSQINTLPYFIKRSSYVGAQHPLAVASIPDYNKPPLSRNKKLEQTLLAEVFRGESFRSNLKSNAVFFSEAFEKYAKSGINIIYLFTPTSPVTQTFTSESDARINDVFSLLEKNGTVADLRGLDILSDDKFYDFQHLNPEGFSIFWNNPVSRNSMKRYLCDEH